jgi:tetratricopeptide (TPR) repeat protein
MKRSWLTITFWILCIAIGSAAASTITGTIYDNRRNSLPDVGVELLDQYHSMKQHTITDGIGRYTFDGIGDGTWYVRVLPFRYDLDEETQSAEIYTISQVNNRPGYTSQVLDFVLTPRKGTLAAAQAEVIYAQEIPPEARKSFDAAQRAVKRGKPDEAIPAYQEAIKTFPNYFLANHFLGALYFERKDYEHAAPVLMKAAQVNDKSSVTLYYLGYSLHKLNYNKAAIVALKAAAILTPASPAIFFVLGSAERMERDYAEAEKALLQAKKLQKTENSELYKELAALYGETKQYQKGAESLEQMLKSGSFSDPDTAKIKEQIKIWKDLSAKQATKSGS